MAISLVANTSAQSGPNSVTTSAIDTSGANLIVVNIASYAGGATIDGTLTDSKSNTWTALTGQSAPTFPVRDKLYYAISPTVGSGHTFSLNGTDTYASINIAAFSGVSAYVSQSGNAANPATTIQPGSLSTSTADSMIITGLAFGDVSTASINSSFTVINQQNWNTGNSEGGALAYKLIPTASSENPTWSITPSTQMATTMAVFSAIPTGYIPAIVGWDAFDWDKYNWELSSLTFTKTQTAIARIATNRTKTQSAIARIATRPTKTQTTRARIARVFTKTQPSTARVSRNFTKTQSATANIITTTIGTKTQTAIARITQVKTLTQSATSRVSQTKTLTQSAKAYVFRGSIYSYGNYASLPTTNAPLANLYTPSQIADVSTVDTVYVDDTGSSLYLIHQFASYNPVVSIIEPTWTGKVGKPAASSPLTLQIYNVSTALWETLNTNTVATPGSNVTITGSQTTNTANYFDTDKFCYVRVYQ